MQFDRRGRPDAAHCRRGAPSRLHRCTCDSQIGCVQADGVTKVVYLGNLALCLILLLGGSRSTDAPQPVPSKCATQLDAFCANETGIEKICYNSIKTRNRTIPLLAGYSYGAGDHHAEWRCYSPDDLHPAHATVDTPIMLRRYTSGPDYCSDATGQLLSIMLSCDPSWKPPSPYPGFPLPLTVFPGGAIPSLAYVPAATGNGTLLAFAQYQGSLGQRRSTDLGMCLQKICSMVATDGLCLSGATII
eukprot:SAG31_NODE_3634_length_4036_cov_10.699517_7_plen_246_part_00